MASTTRLTRLLNEDEATLIIVNLCLESEFCQEDETSYTSMPFKREAQRSENDRVCRNVDMGLFTGLGIWFGPLLW